jgi:hypothetical protein
MTPGEKTYALISDLWNRGRIVSVQIDGGPCVGVVECTEHYLTWVDYADHPIERNIVHVVNFSAAVDIAIEDCGPRIVAQPG